MKKRFFEVARKESYLSDYDGQHLGAVAGLLIGVCAAAGGLK